MCFWGLDWNEALCFGLGQGLGAFYLVNPNMSPSRWFMVRAADLERKFFTSLGIPFEWKQAPDDEIAWRMTKADIDSGLPVLLQTDIYYLDYYDSKTHFNRHAVLLWGYDEGKDRVYLSDTGYEELMEIPAESLSRTRSSKHLPGPVIYDWFPIGKPENYRSVEEAALAAVRVGALQLTSSPTNYPMKFGLNALAELARDLPSWDQAEDWVWSARFTYQVIEKRGTGGSAFRKMYAEFLTQVEEMDAAVGKFGLSEKMRIIADTWSEMAALFKEISEMDRPARFDEAARLAQRLYELETDYCKIVLEGILGGKEKL